MKTYYISQRLITKLIYMFQILFYLENTIAETTIRSLHKLDKDQLIPAKNEIFPANSKWNKNSVAKPSTYAAVLSAYEADAALSDASTPQDTRIKVSEFIDPDLKHIISLIQVSLKKFGIL